MENKSPATPHETVTNARLTCRELMALLMEENAGLIHHDVALVESRLGHKKRLTLRLEQLLKDLKQTGSLWKADTNTHNQALHLAEEVKHFQELAHSNVLMLQAAHQLRADLVVAIRDAVDAQTPKAQLYGSTGAIRPLDGATRLVAREV